MKAAGGLLVEILNKQQGSRLLKMQKIQDIEVEVVPHTILNTTQRLVVCSDLLKCTEEEIATEMTSQGVIVCRRLTVGMDRQTLLSAFNVLTFKRTTLP